MCLSPRSSVASVSFKASLIHSCPCQLLPPCKRRGSEAKPLSFVKFIPAPSPPTPFLHRSSEVSPSTAFVASVASTPS